MKECHLLFACYEVHSRVECISQLYHCLQGLREVSLLGTGVSLAASLTEEPLHDWVGSLQVDVLIASMSRGRNHSDRESSEFHVVRIINNYRSIILW